MESQTRDSQGSSQDSNGHEEKAPETGAASQPSHSSPLGLPDSSSTVNPLSTMSLSQTSELELRLEETQTQGSTITEEKEEEEEGGQDLMETQPYQKIDFSSNVYSQETLEEEQEVVPSSNPASLPLPEVGATPSESPGANLATSERKRAKTDTQLSSPEAKKAKADEEDEKSFFDVSDDQDEEDKETPSQSIVVDNSAISDKNDQSATEDKSVNDSVICLDDEITPKALPKLRLPHTRLASTEGLAYQDSSSSETLFTKLANKSKSFSSDPEGPRALVESDITVSMATSHDEENAVSHADDEATSGKDKDDDEGNKDTPSTTPAGQAVNKSLFKDCLVDSNNVSVSPIEHSEATDAAAKRSRISSTPVMAKSPKKRTAAKQAPHESSDDDETTKVSAAKTRKRASPKKTRENDFKVPNKAFGKENICPLFLVGAREGGMSKSQAEKLRAFLQDNFQDFLEFQVPREKFGNFYSKVQDLGRDYLPVPQGSPEYAQLRRGRLSEGSTSSSMSRTSSNSAGSGYLADGSSGSSVCTGSEGSKRDRLSIMPDATIDKHNVLSPLPTAVRARRRAKAASSQGKKTEDKDVAPPMDSDSPAIDSEKMITSSPKEEIKPKSPLPEQDETLKTSRQLETVPEDDVLPPRAGTNIYVDSLVFAKFIEGRVFRFWPAAVKAMVSENSWRVEFTEDGKEKVLQVEDIIPAESLVPGHNVHVIFKGSEGICQTGDLISYPDLSCKDTIGYQIKFDKVEGAMQVEEKLVSFQEIFLDADQVKLIKKDLGGKWMTPSVSKADLDLSNILDLPRSRRKKLLESPSTTPSKRRGNRSDTSDNENKTPVKKAAAATETPKRASARRKKGGENVETSAQETEVETTPAEKKTSGKRRTTGTRRRAVSSTTTDDEAESSTPSTKRKSRRGSKDFRKEDLFAGCTFLLTQGTRPDPNHQQLETETEETESELNNSMIQALAFKRSDVRGQILAHGGTVLDSFPGPTKAVPRELIVVSDRSCETMSFLLAVTYNFPRVSHQWVVDSIGQRKRQEMKNYFLPVGFSQLEKREIEQHEVKSMTEMLKGRNVLLTSSTSHFVNDWKALLTRLGASVCSRVGGKAKIDRTLKKIDYVVADKGSPEDLLKDAKAKGLPVVSTKWVIQSLINGTVLNVASYRT